MDEVTLINVSDRLESYSLNEGRNVVGRSVGGKNQVNVPARNPYVSRRQCVIYVSDGEVKIEDTNSKNKTYMNQVPIKSGKKYALRDGDIIRFGKKYNLEVCIKDGDEYPIGSG